MNNRFRPEGKDSGMHYVFVSYSSKDKDVVFNNCIFPLIEKYGLHVYWDDAFKDEANVEWSRQMRQNLDQADAVILFVSNDYIKSYACFIEALLTYLYSDLDEKRFMVTINFEDEKCGTADQRVISDHTLQLFQTAKEYLDRDLKGLTPKFKTFIDDIIRSKKTTQLDISYYFCQLLKKYPLLKIDIKNFPNIDTSVVNSLTKLEPKLFERRTEDRETTDAEKTAAAPAPEPAPASMPAPESGRTCDTFGLEFLDEIEDDERIPDGAGRFFKDAKTGDPDAIFEVGIGFLNEYWEYEDEDDLRSAGECFQASANREYVLAFPQLWYVARALKNFTYAFNVCAVSANKTEKGELNIPNAFLALGMMFYRGEGTERKFDKALEYLRKALAVAPDNNDLKSVIKEAESGKYNDAYNVKLYNGTWILETEN